MDQKLIDALQEIMNDFYSSHMFYRAESDELNTASWYGFYRWFHHESHEEMHRAHKIARYLAKRGIVAKYSPITIPTIASGEDPVSCFQFAYDYEEEIDKKINDVSELAESVDDGQTEEFLDWYLSNATHECAEKRNLLVQVKRAKNDIAALQALDKKFKKL